jgi:hypothetical protein
MFCPNCGNDNSAEQRFCRLCGLRLDGISQVVRQELQESESKVQIVHGSAFNLRSLLLTAWHYGLFLMALGMIIIGVGKKLIGEQLIADIGTVTSLLGLGLLVARGMLLLKGQTNRPPNVPAKADTTTQLTPLLEAKEHPSVTDFTTRNFDPAYAERHEPEATTSNRRSNS